MAVDTAVLEKPWKMQVYKTVREQRLGYIDSNSLASFCNKGVEDKILSGLLSVTLHRESKVLLA